MATSMPRRRATPTAVFPPAPHSRTSPTPGSVRLAERLTDMAPGALERVFFADSGSVAVEVAIKMCLQFQRARGEDQRTRLLTVRGGYHGDTLGAMSVCDPVGGMHRLFTGVLPRH